VEIVYDPYPEKPDAPGARFTCVEGDEEWVAAYYEMPEEGDAFKGDALGSFVLRLVLDLTLLRFKGITLEEIKRKVRQQYPEPQLEVICTDENAELPVLRVRVMTRAAGDEQGDAMLFKLQRTMLDDMCLRGVEGIPKVFIRKEMQQRWDDGFVPSEEWVLDTEGTNLEDVIVFEGVDHTRTVSNDILQTLAVLGIEGRFRFAPRSQPRAGRLDS
jgi:DNA-directed RNA polymerase II subunit RPB1